MSNPHAIIENVSRRYFLKGVVSAGGLVLAAQFLPIRSAFAYATGAGDMPQGAVNDPHVFISIDDKGLVTIVTHRSEMGTGSRTSLPMVVADELEADWARVRVVQAPGDEAKYGNQDTDGSRSMRHFIQPMRECGAAARLMLETAAAKRWGVAVAEVEARNHEVIHKPSGKKLGYGEIAADASALPTPAVDTLKLKDPASFRYIGKGQIQMVDLFDITVGRATYGQDIRLPGMKYAVIARPPVVGGTVASFDAAAAMAVPGVEKVVKIDGTPAPAKFAPLGGVAVVARNTWAALQGREALKVAWDDGPNKIYDSAAYKAQLEATARQPGKIVRNDGDVEKALAAAAKTVTAEYYLPHLAHAAMEPPAATARFADGFGRKSKCDYAQEAAILAREVGAPVKVVWTREDDIQHSFYHTVSLERIEAGFDANKKVVAWRHRSVAPTILSTFAPDPKHEMALELGMGFVDVPFAIPNLRCENGEAAAHVRIGWFRSVSNIPHCFAIQSFAAELANAMERDPKDFLLELIGPPRIVDPRKSDQVAEFWNYGDPFETYPIDTARLRRVVELAAEKAGWGRKLPPRHGLGIAVHRSFLSYIATVIEAAVDDKSNLTVPQVDTAIDCGFAANPERIRSQIEGAAVMGMSLARYGEVSFKNGRAEQSNFNDYQVIRIGESPAVTNTHIVPNGIEVPSSGVGEPGLPPFAPALCNAIFAATGKRIRRLPIADQLST